MRALSGDASGRGLRGFCDPGLLEVRAGPGSVASLRPVARDSRGPLTRGRPGRRGATRLDTALRNAGPESAALGRHAGCHVLSPDGIAGCAPVNYESQTVRSDRSSDDSPLSGKSLLGIIDVIPVKK